MGNYKYCLCFTRSFRWREAEPPPDVKAAFAAYAVPDSGIGKCQLRRFLTERQGEEPEDADRIVKQIWCRLVPKPSRHILGLEDFQHFLFSNELNPSIGSQVHQDMTAPISQYYIYTGHNSYLTGNQLSSDCSDIPIIKALQAGVRVIELDMWPNSTKDNIDILHGRTLTTPVELIKCLSSIKEYAFVASIYPLIITLEDHLTPDLQAKVAEMVTKIFGDMLYYPDSEHLEEFPSPEDLKKRIILSTKPPKEYLESNSFQQREDHIQMRKNTPMDEAAGNKAMDVKPELDSDGKKDEINQNEHRDDDDTDDEDNLKMRHNSAHEYKCLIAITAGKPNGSLKDAFKVDPVKVSRLSLSEQELDKAAESHGADIIRFTQKNLLRIYPKGTRFNSSNYDPLIGWMHGAQMVAFNMEGYGRYLWLMQGLFRANGGCGYVKKPDFLLNSHPNSDMFDPNMQLPVKKTLKVKLYMGDGWHLDFKPTHFDRYSPPDFYTRIGISGVPADTIMRRTRTIKDDWTPVWGEEFTFPLSVPELALLRISVSEYDISDKDDFGGQTCLPVWELRPGIRAVPLFDRKGIKFNSVRLLMHFEFFLEN